MMMKAPENSNHREPILNNNHRLLEDSHLEIASATEACGSLPQIGLRNSIDG